MKKVLLALCLIAIGVLGTLGILFGFELLPRNDMGFDFNTLGLYLGAVIPAITIVVAIEQLKKQTENQKQNIALQLFDRRMEIYKKFISLFSKYSKQNNVLNSSMKIFLDESSNDCKTFSHELLIETKIIFDEYTYSQIKEYIELINRMGTLYASFLVEKSIIIRKGFMDGDFEEVINKLSGSSIYKKSEKLLEKICRVEKDPYLCKDARTRLYPNKFYDDYTEIKRLNKEISNKYGLIINKMEKTVELI